MRALPPIAGALGPSGPSAGAATDAADHCRGRPAFLDALGRTGRRPGIRRATVAAAGRPWARQRAPFGARRDPGGAGRPSLDLRPAWSATGARTAFPGCTFGRV